MLHSKFCGKLSTGTSEEDLKGFLPYMGLEAILSCDKYHFSRIFISMFLKAYTQNLIQNG